MMNSDTILEMNISLNLAKLFMIFSHLTVLYIVLAGMNSVSSLEISQKNNLKYFALIWKQQSLIKTHFLETRLRESQADMHILIQSLTKT